MNDQFNEQEQEHAHKLTKQLRSTLMTLVSFYDVDFTYENAYLVKTLDSCRDGVKVVIKNHLSTKSLQRVDMIFDFFTKTNFFDVFYDVARREEEKDRPGSFYSIQKELLADVNLMLERGELMR